MANKKKALITNGLTSFELHSRDPKSAKMMSALETERRTPGIASSAVQPMPDMDPESAAKQYLQQTLASKAVPQMTAPVVDEAESEFKPIGTESIPLTGTTTVKFRQMLNKIPVYGSLVTVELGDANKLIGIRSAVGEPTSVKPVAKISPAKALASVKGYHGYKKDLDNAVPRLNYYFDDTKWRLCYIFEDVPVTAPKSDEESSTVVMDYFVDAQTGEVVRETPRTSTMAAVTGADGLGQQRQFEIEISGKKKVLKNLTLNVWTYDFSMQDPELQANLLPGKLINNPPAFSGAAISAHANASEVSRFMREQLKRTNIDGQGGAMISSINCVSQRESTVQNEWLNAFWNSKQMVYGQRKVGNVYLSLAVALEVVGHEMFHGVTEKTARLEYSKQSGALNESYSDIFGVIIKNFNNPNVSTWDWNIGAGLLDNGRPFRNMAQPKLYNQPDHMNGFVVSPDTRAGDYGSVHLNSGIHNKAAYNVLTASNAAGTLIFNPVQVAAIFYLSLTQYLSRTSQFIDSRGGVLSWARSFFRNLSQGQLAEKIKAIETAFNEVGIA